MVDCILQRGSPKPAAKPLNYYTQHQALGLRYHSDAIKDLTAITQHTVHPYLRGFSAYVADAVIDCTDNADAASVKATLKAANIPCEQTENEGSVGIQLVVPAINMGETANTIRKALC